MDDAVAYHEEEILGKAYDARLMRRLLRYLKPYRGMVAIAVGLIFLAALLELVGPLATAVAIDLFIAPVGEVAETPTTVSRWVGETLEAAGILLTPEQGILAIAIVFLVSMGLAFVVLYWQSMVLQMMGQHIMRDLRNEIFERLQALPVRYFDRNPIGRLVTRTSLRSYPPAPTGNGFCLYVKRALLDEVGIGAERRFTLCPHCRHASSRTRTDAN